MEENTHTCKAVVLHCIDFRFQKTIQEFLETEFPNGYDRIALAGAVKELLEKREESTIFKNLQISSQLHQPKAVVLIQHEDCGAYGGSKRFQSIEQELDFQRQELQKAKALLAKQFPDKSVETYFIRLSRGVDPVDLRG